MRSRGSEDSEAKEVKKLSLEDAANEEVTEPGILPMSQLRKTTRGKKRHNVADREHHVFRIDAEEIFAVTQEHEKYGDGRMKLKGLTRFDDCSGYGISDDAHRELVRKEIDKLIAAVTADGPHLFDSGGLLPRGSLADFEEAESVIDQLYCNLAILTHDNAQIGMWNTAAGPILELAIKSFTKSREILLSRFGEADDNVEGAEPLILEPPERNRSLYHRLLDYILATMGRCLLRSATSKQWVKYSLAILALWAVKLKLAAYEPSRYAKQSISNGEDIVDRLAELRGSKRMVFLKVNVKRPDGREGDEERETQHDTLSTNTSLKTFYYENHLLFRHYMKDLFRFLVFSILDINNLQKGINSACFEACTIVYKAGLESVMTAANQDRFGNRANLEAIHSRNQDLIRSGLARTKSVAATVKWDWPGGQGTESEERDRTTLLYSMDDILTVAMTHVLSTPYFANSVALMIRMVSSGTTHKDPIFQFSPPPKSFHAMFHIVSDDCVRSQRQAKLQLLEDLDVQGIPISPLRHGIRAGTNLRELDVPGTAHSKSKPDHSQQLLVEYRAHKRKMDKWIISEDAITIRCRAYVITIVIIALTVVCGSMAVPFLVRNSISGVDPFQFATFAWVITGFLVIIAKSRYVSDWPWHHFLHGKIVCKSISDVRSVSGINAQMILMKLLHGEGENIMKTSGPFNGMFTRKSRGSDGFSIDRPVKLSTMLASGFIVFKVSNESGEHLICGDVRKGTGAGGFTADTPGKYLTYKDLDFDESEVEAQDDSSSLKLKSKDRRGGWRNPRDRGEQGKVFLLRGEEFQFNKIVGIYVRDSYFG